MKKFIIIVVIFLFVCEKNPVNKDYSYLKFIIYSYLNAKDEPLNNLYIAAILKDEEEYFPVYDTKIKISINDSIIIEQKITFSIYKKIKIDYKFSPATTYNIKLTADDSLFSYIDVYIPENTNFTAKKTNNAILFNWLPKNKICGYIIRGYFYDTKQNITVPIKKYTIINENSDYIDYTESELTGIITDTFYTMPYSIIENFKKIYYSRQYGIEIDSVNQIVFYLYSLTEPTLKYLTVDKFSDNIFSAKIFNFDYMNLEGDLKGFIGGIAKDTLIYKIK